MKRSPLKRKTPLRATRGIRRARNLAAKISDITVAKPAPVSGVLTVSARGLETDIEIKERMSQREIVRKVKRALNAKPKRKSKYKRRPRALAYMQWVKTLPCAALNLTPPNRHPHQVRCEGPIEADHAGKRGMGQKAPDYTCIPLCRKHHRDRTDVDGLWCWCPADKMREWCDEVIKRTQLAATLAGIEIPSC